MSNIDWSSIGFGYMKTNKNIRATYKDGAWSDFVLTDEETVPIHMSASCLHYGTEIFEGLKAFRGVDGKVRIFRPDENGKRMAISADMLCMQSLPVDKFVEACVEVVKANIEFVPPYESGASLYLRPFILASEAVLGVKPAKEFFFCIFVSPVGPYFKGGMTPIDVVIDVESDRAAPRGTGRAKCGGNYAASLLSGERAHDNGFSNVLFLDAVERKYIEECGAANFFGIKNGTYITPVSPSILHSITNMSLRTLASEEYGLKIEERPIAIDELPTFDECGACGTAAVISPIGSVCDYRHEEKITYGTEPGKYCIMMYNKLQDIQYGRCEDRYGWTVVVE
ncbi:MAG: branched-chain amino acid aminotransferase [Rikenellaceae bacterium]